MGQNVSGVCYWLGSRFFTDQSITDTSWLIPNRTIHETELSYTSTFMFFMKAGILASALWFLGNRNYNLELVWVLAIIYVWREQHTLSLQHRVQLAREIKKNEKAVILASCKNLPAWVHFPDFERTQWLNRILEQFWPYICQFMENYLIKDWEPYIQASLLMKTFKFVKIDLGTLPPRLSGVKVHSQPSKDEIILDVELEYVNDADIKFSLRGVTSGIRGFFIRGTLRIVLCPLVNVAPLFGGMFFFFLQQPELNFNLTGFANALELPGLSELLRIAIDNKLSQLIVLPNRLPVEIIEGLDIYSRMFPPPEGIIRIHIIEAKKLKGTDFFYFRQKKSDPYCVLKIGGQDYKTSIVKKTLNPTWNEIFDLIVDTVEGQRLNLEVFDHDALQDDKIGSLSLNLKHIMQRKTVDEWFKLQDVSHGSIHLSMSWFHLTDNKEEFQRVIENSSRTHELHTALLMVTLFSAKDLPRTKQGNDPSPQVFLSVDQAVKTSSIQFDTTEPKWTEHFRFLISSPAHQILTLEVRDTKYRSQLGTLTIHLIDLIDMRKLSREDKFYLKTAGEPSTVNLKLQLMALTTILMNEDFDGDPDLVRNPNLESFLNEREGSSVDLSPSVGLTAKQTKIVTKKQTKKKIPGLMCCMTIKNDSEESLSSKPSIDYDEATANNSYGYFFPKRSPNENYFEEIFNTCLVKKDTMSKELPENETDLNIYEL